MSRTLTAAHTPGPWEARDENVGGGYNIYAGALRVAHTSIVCAISKPKQRPIGEDEAKANAILAAASPEMLEALREAEGELYQVPPADAEQERVLGIVRAAIAKATGRLALKEAGDGQG